MPSLSNRRGWIGAAVEFFQCTATRASSEAAANIFKLIRAAPIRRGPVNSLNDLTLLSLHLLFASSSAASLPPKVPAAGEGCHEWGAPQWRGSAASTEHALSDMWSRNEKRIQSVETQADKMICAQADAADPLHYVA